MELKSYIMCALCLLFMGTGFCHAAGSTTSGSPGLETLMPASTSCARQEVSASNPLVQVGSVVRRVMDSNTIPGFMVRCRIEMARKMGCPIVAALGL